MKISQDEFERNVKDISLLSNKINNHDNEKILVMMKNHVDEIIERYHDNDDHWSIETADLIVLCFELLLLGDKNIDEVFNMCLPRFDKKLGRLLSQQNHNRVKQVFNLQL
jgi:hypothetical protein